MPQASETRVWFLRHGASTFNLEHRCQGCSDESELTAKGREGARLSGERLAGEGIQAVISSPLRRAAHTAEELLKEVRAQECAVAFEIDDRLREIELYHWEGLHLEEIPRSFPEQYRNWRLHPDKFCMQLADNGIHYPVRSLFDRVRSLWNDLLTSYAGKSILLVAHGGTIRSLIASALGLGEPHFHTFQQSNCGLSRLRFLYDSGPAKLELLNDTKHLGERLPKLKEALGVRFLLIPVSDTEPGAVRRAATALEGVAIHNLFVVGATAHRVANRLLSYCPDSCMMVSEAVGADTVVDQVLARSSRDRPCHVVVLAPPATLRRALEHQLGISAITAESLDLRPFEITSVHHPGSGTAPVLQALNMLPSVSGLVEV